VARRRIMARRLLGLFLLLSGLALVAGAAPLWLWQLGTGVALTWLGWAIFSHANW